MLCWNKQWEDEQLAADSSDGCTLTSWDEHGITENAAERLRDSEDKESARAAEQEHSGLTVLGSHTKLSELPRI